MFPFEKFEVYNKAEKLHSEFVRSVFSRKGVDKNVKDQLRRASLSILLNIAEGTGKYTYKDKKNFYTVARGSAFECVALLRVLRIEGQISGRVFDEQYGLLVEVSKMLTGLISRMSERVSSGT